eukprot:CAMPEP_0168491540 /NCGR_PEP_ID=MMETSP0228-20121227/69750_1 /TAXON_ID=133427 /ORGANISM="Protoceratium reticulatum, Strain CCCM 535 (=CCMP 1889)" /LENGTH=52 /DNA_ID=CAMNT_0008508283 /DNA_START=20 /DNA_END=175 /DNA_ORIENTATION=+
MLGAAPCSRAGLTAQTLDEPEKPSKRQPAKHAVHQSASSALLRLMKAKPRFE